MTSSYPITAAIRPFPTMRPIPVEDVAVAYFTAMLDPLVVCTRNPESLPGEDTPGEFLRIQAGGGRQLPNWYWFDMSVILHSYAPNDLETHAERNLGDAIAWGANAQGTLVTIPNGDQYWITYSFASGTLTRLGDPLVDMIRYRGMVTWRVQGHQLAPNPVVPSPDGQPAV